MTGAESLIRTLLASGIEVCFANPGTTEIQFVIALDRNVPREPCPGRGQGAQYRKDTTLPGSPAFQGGELHKVEGMRCVLGMAEGVVTGCADGYGRMAEKPAVTLLHCGPGFANGIIHVHNARRANTPMVNIVGDQATYHRPFDPPLAADTEGLALAVSHWVRTSDSARQVASEGAAAVRAARTPPGQIATLIVPADVAWGEGSGPSARLPVEARPQVLAEDIQGVARILRSGEPAMLLISGQALSEKGLASAQRIAHGTGAMLRASMHVPRMSRGRGRVSMDRIPYAVDSALQVLAGLKHLILVGAKPPVAFFAYPGKPSTLAPPDCAIHVLAQPEQDAITALEWLSDDLGVPRIVTIEERGPEPRIVRGPFNPEGFGLTLAALLPENAIVADDAVTSGRTLFSTMFKAAPHDWLQITGGTIGHAFPCATGAAVACPERKVVCLQGDGGGMYSLQALWTQAREKLDVVNVVFANRMYQILHGELRAAGATPGPASRNLFDIARPVLDWVALSRGMGVEAVCVETMEGFADTFRSACAQRGPFLIEFRI